MHSLTMKKKIRVLEHAFAASAGAYYSINLTKNLVPGSMYQVIEDKEYSINEQIGMKENASFSEVVNYWGSKLEENEKEAYFSFFDISNLLKHHKNGEDHVWHRYWTKTALFEPMLAEQHILMYDDEETQDVLAITYVLDQTEQAREQKYNELLEQKNKELETMLQVERKYSGIMSALSKVYWQIYSVDLQEDTYIEVFNGWRMNNERLCDQKKAQASFRNILHQFVCDEYLDRMDAFLNHATLNERLKNCESVSMDFYAVMKQWLCATYVVQQRDETGKVCKVLFTIRNINEQKIAEFEQQKLLKQSALAANAANRAKSTFLLNMSHDIRTPLNGIIGLLKIDNAHFDDKEFVRENHKKMLVAANHLLSLINDILQMSRLEEGTFELAHEVVDLASLSDEVETIIKVRAKDEGISFITGNQNLVCPYVYGSPTHLRQIFLNIYGNCIKYNKVNGSLTTSMECIQKDQNMVTYQWHISDTGIGMSEEFIKHIYEPFAQEDTYHQNRRQGIGLGMSIVKNLIAKMNGKIEIHSTKDVGTTFIITLPFEIASKPEKIETDETVSIKGFNLLVVEDNELNAEIAKTILEDYGAQVEIASNGLDGVNAFKESSENTYDAILMDVMMPTMNGLQATQEIRKLDREDAKTIPIIAMTANAFKEDEKRCLDAGMNAHLAKPLDIKEMIATIARLKNGIS